MLEGIFNKRMVEILGARVPSKLMIALSGGVDSIALASVASKWAKSRNIQIFTVTIDHKLRPESTLEAKEVVRYAYDHFGAKKAILYTISDSPKSTNLEEWARNKRRKALGKVCKQFHCDLLLMAHHLDDQKELFIQRLIKGSHWRGLAGMRPLSPLNHFLSPLDHPVDVLRPLLTTPKQNLINYCLAENLKVWEDPTNSNTSYTQRNLIRKYLQTTPEEKIPIKNIPAEIDFFSELNNKVNEVANQLYMRALPMVNIVQAYAQIELPAGIQQTPTAILTEFLYRLALPLSPMNHEQLSLSRHRLIAVSERIRRGEDFEFNCLRLNFTLKNNELTIKREYPRRSLNETEENCVYLATHKMSRFHLIDNRWYARWRLNPKSEESKKYFRTAFVDDVSFFIKHLKLKKPVKTETIDMLKRLPILIYENRYFPSKFNENRIIGFPGVTREQAGIFMDFQPIRCRF